MLACHFKLARRPDYLNSGPAAPFLEGFVHALETRGYADPTIRYHVGAVHHLCGWAAGHSRSVSTFDDADFGSFLRHLPSCRCPHIQGGKFIHHARFSVGLFGTYLREVGILPLATPRQGLQQPILTSFHHWMLNHRGVKESTLKIYARLVPALLETVAGDAASIDARTLRSFFAAHSKNLAQGSASNVANAVRMFVRYLIAEGISAPGLDNALPTTASWRNTSLPRSLPSSDIDRVIAACDPSTKQGLRDRAIILLMVRLGLRASDICNLRLEDFDWHEASIWVSRKGRRAAQMPLPQEIGDAVLAYLQSGRPPTKMASLFVRHQAPIRPFASSSAISGITAAAIHRAGIQSPCRGAHVLRHSTATTMLRNGVSLQDIGTVLRHRSLHTTLHYAKVDTALLQVVVNPWPEVAS